MMVDWARLGTRVAVWWQGIQAGGAAQDDLIFAGLAGILLWTLGVLTGWLARRYRQGFLVAAPSLWLLGTVLLYSSAGRSLMITGLALATLAHLLLDYDALLQRWQALGLDFNPGLFLDRILAVLVAGALVLALASLLPNLYMDALVMRYYEVIAPWNQRLEELAERLFPDVKGTSRLRSGGLGGGLPNEFLLRGGVELGETEVMRVRTNESNYVDYPYYEETPPPGYYMRGGTLTLYDGRGWQNPSSLTRRERLSNERWTDLPLEGRRLLVQSIFLTFNSQVLYAAPEPLEPATDYRLDVRAQGDLVALWGRERSYTIVSAVPAVSEEMLRTEPAWSAAEPLPAGYEIHLQLPDAITERTRQLAAELTAGLDSPFDKAQAIESYLRTYEYDLTVSEPPKDVADVADFFLFDLRRGYCDYYATAFVVLARLAGLPARFATGFAVGNWSPNEGVWVVTEAEAHSWPELYFPKYGWIQFEPTAGRPALARVGSPPVFSGAVAAAETTVEPLGEAGVTWNWQMLFWFIPAGLLIWGVFLLAGIWRLRQEDPWQGLLRWGQRAGRPMAQDETVLEYGQGLAGYVLQRQTREPDHGRFVAREVTALSNEVSTLRYGPVELRPQTISRVDIHWQRLRGYLRHVHLSR
jgi:transglutaminase-like putative cysteine protease